MEDILSEKLTVEMSVEARGDLGTTHPTLPQQEYAMDVAAAEMECDDAEEDNKALNKALKKIMGLEEHVSTLKLEKNKLGSDYKELKSLAKQVSDKLVDLNISNAKLVYENRVLKTTNCRIYF
jgi:archaellum component FlaC